MKIREVILGIIASSISLFFFAQTSQKPHSANPSNAAVSARMHVAPDLKQRLARFQQVHMPFDPTQLTPREHKMLLKLVDAGRYLEDIYWRQSDPDGLELYESLEQSTNPASVDLRRYLWINGSRFDLLDGQKP